MDEQLQEILEGGYKVLMDNSLNSDHLVEVTLVDSIGVGTHVSILQKKGETLQQTVQLLYNFVILNEKRNNRIIIDG